jgi:hypothetical protein
MQGKFNDLQSAILATISYFDIFNYPLTLGQIYLLISTDNVSVDRVLDCIESGILNKYVDKKNNYYFLKGKSIIVDTLNSRIKKASQLELQAMQSAKYMRHLPFIRGIYLSGDLSKGVSSKNSDIDFFIITAANRVYIAKLFLAMFRRIPFFNPGKLLCFNYLIDETHLELEEKNQFTAMEVAYLGMLYNKKLYEKFFKANHWVEQYVPRYQYIRAGRNELPYCHSRIRFFLEFPFRNPLGALLDKVFMYIWRFGWGLKYQKHRNIKRLLLAGTQRTFCKAHGLETDRLILKEYNRRLFKIGIKSDPKEYYVNQSGLQ